MDNYKFLEDSPWFIFMNHGYSPASKLLDENNIFINSASLYLNLLEDIDTEGKTILDIGCGRGGGVKTYSEVLEFNKIHACDYNEKFIDFCKHTHNDIEFKVCSATELTSAYNQNTFDIITNVESSHCYFDFPTDEDLNIVYPTDNAGFLIRHVFGLNKFFNGVSSILKSGGVFCYTDAFSKDQLIELKYSNFNTKFKNIVDSDITKNVILACEEILDTLSTDTIPNSMVKKYMEHVAKQKIIEYKSGQKYLKFICTK
jgi:O-methyltransferase